MAKEHAVYLHIDGMDLAGKTTTARRIIIKVGGEWNVRTNSLSDNNPIYLLADSLRKEDTYAPEILGHLYTVAMMADVAIFQWPTTNTIQDSTIILRSLAYHTISGNINISAVLDDILPKHPDFDASFVLTASLEARLKRLDSRRTEHPENVASDDLMIVRKPEKFLAMEACLTDIASKRFRAQVIDTTNMTPDMVVSQVLRGLLEDTKSRLVRSIV